MVTPDGMVLTGVLSWTGDAGADRGGDMSVSDDALNVDTGHCLFVSCSSVWCVLEETI